MGRTEAQVSDEALLDGRLTFDITSNCFATVVTDSRPVFSRDPTNCPDIVRNCVLNREDGDSMVNAFLSTNSR